MPAFDSNYAFDWVFLDPARVAYESLDEMDQVEFDRLVDCLCRDPWEDGQRKTELILDDGTCVTLFDDDAWQVIYLIVEPRIVEIWALSKNWWGA